MRSMLLPVLALPVLLAAHGNAHACSIAATLEHHIDLTQVGVDTTAPGPIAAVIVDVTRGHAAEACTSASSSCADLGMVHLTVTPGQDDRTPGDELGYRLVLVKGRLPKGLSLPSTPVRAVGQGITLVWIDGDSDSQEGVSFTLQLIPMDLAGNEGPPREVRVSDPGSGCSAGRAELPLWVLLALVAGRLARSRGGRGHRCG